MSSCPGIVNIVVKSIYETMNEISSEIRFEGVNRLYGVKNEAPDLRGGAGLVTAALAAEGTSEISNIHYIDRGYEEIEKVLASVGADITRI